LWREERERKNYWNESSVLNREVNQSFSKEGRSTETDAFARPKLVEGKRERT